MTTVICLLALLLGLARTICRWSLAIVVPAAIVLAIAVTVADDWRESYEEWRHRDAIFQASLQDKTIVEVREYQLLQEYIVRDARGTESRKYRRLFEYPGGRGAEVYIAVAALTHIVMLLGATLIVTAVLHVVPRQHTQGRQ